MKGTIEVQAAVEWPGVLPSQERRWDAGYDLRSISDTTTLQPGERALFRTGVALAIPEGYAGFIKPRSGLAVRHGIDVLAGVIDAGYRGEIQVLLLNTGDDPVDISFGMRMAQLVVTPVMSVDFIETLALEESERGAGGFGSTGTH